MQIYVFAALVFGWAASLGLTGWKAYEFGQGECRLEVAQATEKFSARVKKFNGRISERNRTRAIERADKEEDLNDRYENALDVIAMYDLQLSKKECVVSKPVREAIGKIR